LNGRLHAIWFVPAGTYTHKSTRVLFRYCIPMDKDWPSLDLKHFGDICPDNNGRSKCDSANCDLYWAFFKVPMIVVFTKFDHFKCEVRIKLED
jgi:hypothetical protein